ncbi:MAG TPA: right-handed parallel beta-helix repeat-containing protein [Candidatus Krumholzibacteria bacterium]|nr:right-handed parallel beta-helix repeat-containing protein [Candidatus Krumholzibacteria bacterium]HPD72100.1 right-handed parallel beta-helix repeat-containing protein [Candidatus Krumholzibacteria bacterium]HRY40968.1 right-handed parallel beta-helix repeat-containing protein [Candidatus Krumholzibacteria bacterium]
MHVRSVVVLLGVLCVGATDGGAATWHVAKDGSGDFAVIQDAIDAAAPGDVIWIHAGRYEELTEGWDVWGNGTSFADCHVVITKDDLTLQGDGLGATIIGPTELPNTPDPNYTGISVTYNEAASLTIRDLAVENVRYGTYIACPACDMANCRFEGMAVDGVRLFTASHCTIDGCTFVNCYTGVHTFYPTANLTISACTFEMDEHLPVRGCACIDSQNVSVNDCSFVGGGGAIDFQQGTTGIISNVVASQFNTCGLVLSLGGFAQVYDSTFEGGLWAVISDGAGVMCERSALRGQSDSNIRINSEGISRFNDCEIINGGGYSVYCDYNGTSDCHVDITNCDWGTDSAAQIDAWIYDVNDGSEYCCAVDYIPFKGMTATEPVSWSAVKSLFRTPER